MSANAKSILIEAFPTPTCNFHEESNELLNKIAQEDKEVLLLNCISDLEKLSNDSEFMEDTSKFCYGRKFTYTHDKIPVRNSFIMINGRFDTQAGYPKTLKSAVKAAKAAKTMQGAVLKNDGEVLSVALPNGIEDNNSFTHMDLWFFGFQKQETAKYQHYLDHEHYPEDEHHEHSVEAGNVDEYEVHFINSVKHVKKLGPWNGRAETISVNLQGLDFDHYAIIAQDQPMGEIRFIATTQE